MKAPKIPSFFKDTEYKKFSFNPRYYNKTKEGKENKKLNIKFNRNYIKKQEKGRITRTIFLIIILSLLTYNFIIN